MKKRARLFGDKCKECKVVLTAINGVMKGVYLQTRCRDCYTIRRDAVPSRTTEARAAQYINWKIGISIEEYKKKSELQFNGCAICKKPCDVRSRLAVDHNHKTGVIRDLLCHRCNVVLGLVEENELLLADLIEYIKKHDQEIAS